MDTEKLTYGGMLSAMIVALTVCVMMTGVGYTIYLDFGLPILIGLIYFKCGFKCTCLCGLISSLLIFFGLGDLTTAIWMVQSIIIGLICVRTIDQASTIMDDLLWCSIGGAFVVIFIDIYCENLLGMSIIKELWQTVEAFPLPEGLKEIAVSIALASLPVGTCLVTYVGTLFVGHKLRVLKGNSLQKFKVMKNFKKCLGYLCCSRHTINRWIIYLLGIQFLKGLELPLYIQTVMGCVQWIALYFILRDAYTFISQFIYTKTKSLGLTKGAGMGIFLLLISKFKLTTVVLTVASYVVDKLYRVRESKIQAISKQVA